MALTCLWMLALVPATAWAGGARVLAASGPEHVVIEVSDACVDEIVESLAAHFEFVVEHQTRSSQGICFSGRLEGSLAQLLERVLRHEGHIIVLSSEARAGISRVVLIEAKGTAPGAVSQDPFASLSVKARSQLPALWAGIR